MPIKRCTTEDDKSGYKWGDKGTCYLKIQDAIKQGYSFEPDKVKRELHQMDDAEVTETDACMCLFARSGACTRQMLEDLIREAECVKMHLRLAGIWEARFDG